ncbi:MAG: class I SAM-dependent methyltransferase [Candidatus Altiarchaeales archaeon HGW-Altiarchaeales-2]|nr:MAG: class I SAM-dependent methyltransferase [Candidatus Altiarchaeales archaeon HGW-Altiarchaeales-2]
MKTQDEIFKEFEGDGWFDRNKDKIGAKESVSSDLPIKLIDLYNLKPKKCLEIGCSNGWRLDEIYKRINCECIGIEPSKKAVDEGRKKFKNIQFFNSTADSIPLDDASVDLLIINFVFHWVDRKTLLKTVYEIDRILKDKGYLIIGDFYPDYPTKVKYHHLPDENIFTFKQNYTDIFISTSCYKMIAFLSGHHETHKLTIDVDSNSRMMTALLQKDINFNYQTKTL